MKRTEYTVTVVDAMGVVIDRRTTYAHNSANARGLDILRDAGGAERASRPAWDDTRTVCRSTWVLARDGRYVTVTVAPTAQHPYA